MICLASSVFQIVSVLIPLAVAFSGKFGKVGTIVACPWLFDVGSVGRIVHLLVICWLSELSANYPLDFFSNDDISIFEALGYAESPLKIIGTEG